MYQGEISKLPGNCCVRADVSLLQHGEKVMTLFEVKSDKRLRWQISSQRQRHGWVEENVTASLRNLVKNSSRRNVLKLIEAYCHLALLVAKCFPDFSPSLMWCDAIMMLQRLPSLVCIGMVTEYRSAGSHLLRWEGLASRLQETRGGGGSSVLKLENHYH